MDLLQRIRDTISRPLLLSSAYRCPIHNAMVGGAPMSWHKAGRAFDIRLTPGIDKTVLIAIAIEVGAGGIGHKYRSFVHVDTGTRRDF